MAKARMSTKLRNFIQTNRIEFILLLLILLVAAVLRLYRIQEYMRFLGDEGRDALAVLHIVRDFHFPLIGPGTSVGNMYMGPLYYYMMLVPMSLTALNPISAAVMVGTIGVATVGLLCIVGREWFGPVAGLTAAALYAVAYLPITFGQSSWNPYPMPFFALAAIFSLYKAIKDQRSEWLILLGIILAFVLQMHPLGLILVPVLGLFWLFGLYWFKKSAQTPKRYLVHTGIGLILFCLLMSPLLLFDLKHNFMNTQAFITFFTKREGTVNINPLNTLSKFWETYSQLYIGRFLAYGYSGSCYPQFTCFNVGGIVSFVLPLLLVVQAFLFYRKRHLSLAFAMLVCWLLLGVLGITLIKSHIYDHYFGFMAPVGFLLVGMLFATLAGFHKWLTYVVAVLVAGYVALLISINPQQDPPAKLLQRTQDVARYVVTESQNKPFNFALIAKNNYDDGYEFFFQLWRHPMTVIDPLHFNETKADQLFVACEDPVCEPVNNDRTEIANYGWKRIDTQTEIDGVKVFRLVPTAAPARE